MNRIYFDSLSKFETGLTEQFARLRKLRPDSPVFLIEHGLEPAEIGDLMDLVGRNLREFGLNFHGWMGVSLPLAVAITEVGYSYRGTGTDFWPKVNASLNADIRINERAAVSRLFEGLSKRHGIAKPYDTDWARAYKHIAWPVRNALAPAEIHRPLILALRQVLTGTTSLRSDAELLTELRSIAVGLWSRRLSDWLEDGELAVSLSRRLLLGEEHQSWLEPGIAHRIANDLRADPKARRSLYFAQRKAGRSGSTALTLPPPGRFFLATVNGNLDRIVFRGPEIDATQKEELVGIVGERCKIIFSGRNVSPIYLGEFLSGGLVDLGQPATAPGKQIIGLADDSDSEITMRIVDALQPEIPALFRWEERTGFQGAVHAASGLPQEGKFVWLTWDAKIEYADLEELPAWPGVRAFLLDAASPAAQPHFRRLGIEPNSRPLVEFAGGISLRCESQTITSIGGFPIFCRALHDNVRLQIKGDSAGLAKTSGLRITEVLPLPLAAGHYTIRATTGGAEVGYDVDILTADTPEPVDCEIDPPNPEIDDLLSDDLTLIISSPIKLENLDARLSIIQNGRLLREEALQIVSIPARIGSRSPAMRELKAVILAEKENLGAADYGLRLVLPGLGNFNWQLPRRSRIYEYDESRSIWAGPDSEEIGSSKVATIDAPLLVSASVPATHLVKNLTLIAPDGERDGSLLSGFLSAPALLEMGQTNDLPALEVSRSAESNGAKHGLLEVAESFVAWSSARPANIYADRLRLRVVQLLERSLVQMLCGQKWLMVERAGDGFQGNALDAFVSICIKRGLAGGEDFPEIHPEELQTMRGFLAKRFAAVFPDLRFALLNDGVVEDLDFAVMDAYDKDLTLYRQEHTNEPPGEVDIGFPENRWRKAIDDALIKAEKPAFMPLVLPENRWQAISDQDYAAVTLNQIVDILAGAHLDVSRRPGTVWLNRRVLKVGLQLWLAPRQLPGTSTWRNDLRRLLSDRQTARAIRYTALRLRGEMVSTRADHV